MEKAELTAGVSTGALPLIQLDLIESTELLGKHCFFVTAMKQARGKQAPAGINSAGEKQGNLPPHSHPLFFFFFGYPKSWSVCAGRQSAPCVASHVTLGSVSLTASGSRGENTIAVSHTTSHWAALQVWAGGVDEGGREKALASNSQHQKIKKLHINQLKEE